MRLIWVKDKEKLEEIGCFLKPSTLYEYHSKNKIPGLFVKIHRKLFIRTDKWLEYLRGNIKEAIFDEIFG